MPMLTIVPPMPGAERRFRPFVDFVHASGWATEFVRLEWDGDQPNFASTALFAQVGTQTEGKVVMGYSLGAVYSHLGALRARHLILGSISPFFLEDEDEPERWMISFQAGNAETPADILVGAKEDAQMHRRAQSVFEFYRSGHQSRATEGQSLRGDQDSHPQRLSSASQSAHHPLPTVRYFPSPTYTVVPDAEHELWHPNYLQSIRTILDRLDPQSAKSAVDTPPARA